MSSSPIAAVLGDLVDHLPPPDSVSVQFTDGDQQGLTLALAAVPDPRRRRGVRHRFTPLLSAARVRRKVVWPGQVMVGLVTGRPMRA
jgi:hypothetical protein